MSSGFVLGGNDDWVRAQAEIEERTRAKLAEGKQDGGKSLYEVLQQNKAIKQEAFEESVKLKNQFRALDEDEVDFLRSINESERTKEDAIKQETAAQLEAFRERRAAADAARLESERLATTVTTAVGAPSDGDTWATKPKKRRRDKDAHHASHQKLVKTSASAAESSRHLAAEEREVERAELDVNVSKDELKQGGDVVHEDSRPDANKGTPVENTASLPKKSAGLGLDYSSDEE